MANMMMRMFHPVNGRCNFETVALTTEAEGEEEQSGTETVDYVHLSCAVPPLGKDYHLPPAEVMAAMLRREEDLRLHPNTQAQYADPSVNSIALTSQLQVQTVREFGFPESHVQLLRSAERLYSREELPMELLPHYVRYNRSCRGFLTLGSAMPDLPLHLLRSPLDSPLPLDCVVPLSEIVRELAGSDHSRPMVLAAGSFT